MKEKIRDSNLKINNGRNRDNKDRHAVSAARFAGFQSTSDRNDIRIKANSDLRQSHVDYPNTGRSDKRNTNARKETCSSGKYQNLSLRRLAYFLVIILISLFLALSHAVSAGAASIQAAVNRSDLDRLDQVLKALEKFDHSQGEGPALELERLIFSLKDKPELKAAAEKRLLQFFAGQVTRDARIAVSKPLSWIAGAESVKALSPYLLNPDISDPARYVLERIPGEEADKALIEALEKAPASVLPGIISSLGHRRVEAAVPHLEKLLQKRPSPQVISNVMETLGNIGGDKAVHILSGYLKASDEGIRLRAVDSLLRVANRDINNEKFKQAAVIPDILLKAKLTPEERLASWRIKILAAGNGSKTQLQAALKGKDESARQAALMLFPKLVSQEEIASYLPLLSGGSENFQIQAAAAMSYYPVSAIREFLIDLASKSPSVNVRTEALVSLGKIGDGSTVEFLVQKAASARGKEKSAARESLLALRGKSIDGKILELLAASTQPDIRNELLLAACERNIRESREYFLKEAANTSADLALVSRGLRAFGDISLAEELLAVAFKTEDEAFRDELAAILAIWAKQSARPDARSTYFRNLLGKETDPARQALLITIIGKIGERNSLPLLRNYAKAQDPLIREAAIRALADWPEVEARDDLLEIARTSSSLKEKVLAIRGLVRLTASERYRQPEAVVESLKMIYALCPRAEEKKLVLSAFPDFACKPALDFCQSLASDPEVGPEAHTAIEKIAQRIKRGT